MAWWAIDKIAFEPGVLALIVSGNDEVGLDWTFKVPLKSHPEAAGWLIKEALERIPKRVDISEETLEKFPGAGDHAGEKLELEPLQVVGKRCAATGKTVSYEPDATVCARCERVYIKRSLPKKCKCGNALGNLRTSEASDDGESETSDAATRPPGGSAASGPPRVKRSSYAFGYDDPRKSAAQ